jgi:2-polyprenyl-6-methoxyphenol hydroxylase-like FAD-dependent oxidoreductase
MPEKHYQVIIAGGGPVGVALAVNLGLRGISCALIESRATLHRIPKGQNLTQRTLEHFYFWGIADELRAARLMPREHPVGEVTTYGTIMGEYWNAPAGREAVGPYYYEDLDRMPQYQMEAVLRQKVATVAGVDLFLGWTVLSIAQDDGSVRAEIAKEDGEDRKVLTGDYLVGCDGARSLVRETVGIARSGTDFDKLMVLLVFRSRELNALLKRFPDRSTYRVMHPDFEGFWQFFGRIDADESFFFHAPVASDTDRANFDFREPLFRAIGRDVAVEFDYTGFWESRNAVADTYRKGRVFIAGDAAHTHPPYGGFGLNNGLEDACNLAWKIAARIHGWGGEALLNSYSPERQPVFRDVAEDFIAARIKEDAAFYARHNPARDRADFEAAWTGRKTDYTDRVRRYEPNYEGSPLVAGPMVGKSGAFGEHRFDARAGHHLSPQMLSSGRNVYEELGQGFTLLAFGAPGGSARAFAEAADKLLIPLKVIEDSFADGRQAYEHRMVLVRPDQFIAWTGEAAPADAGALMRQVAGLG